MLILSSIRGMSTILRLLRLLRERLLINSLGILLDLRIMTSFWRINRIGILTLFKRMWEIFWNLMLIAMILILCRVLEIFLIRSNLLSCRITLLQLVIMGLLFRLISLINKCLICRKMVVRSKMLVFRGNRRVILKNFKYICYLFHIIYPPPPIMEYYGWIWGEGA